MMEFSKTMGSHTPFTLSLPALSSAEGSKGDSRCASTLLSTNGKRVWILLGWIGLHLLAGAVPAQAATGDAAGTYTVTVTQVEMSSDGGGSYTTIFSGSKEINIASANAGAVAASLASGVTLPPALYNRIRVTLAQNLQLKGFVNDGATTFYTNNDSDGFGLNLGAADTPGADYAISTFTIPAGNRVNTITVSINIPATGSAPTVRVNFDTTGVLTVSGSIPSVGAPTVTVTQS